jgi:hypothetical protein
MSPMQSVLIVTLILAAAPAAARDPILNLPVDCVLGRTCHIQNYMDHDGGPGAADFACGPLTYDDHSGTDFALPSLAAMAAGVDVLAAAPGTVTAVRDGMADVAFDDEGAEDTTGRECGNGVVVDHGGGWETQYCHLKQGSVAVEAGRRVGKGTVLGQVGLSGRTQFPHLHLSLRHDGARVDPFLPDGIVQCLGPAAGTLWQDVVPYAPGGLIAAGFLGEVPTSAAVKAGAAAALGLPASGGLVIWGYGFGLREGDAMTLSIRGPAGVVVDEVQVFDRPQAQAFRALGRKAGAAWPAGVYEGRLLLVRDGVELDRIEVAVPVE